MGETLETRLKQLRLKIRLALVLYGAAWLICVFLGVTLLAGMLDWLLHLNDPSLRLLLGLTILLSTGWVCWKQLILPLLVRFSDVDLALLVERRYREFKESLASTVEFQAANTSAKLGSPVLQRKVIEETLRRSSGRELDDLIETRTISRMVLAAVLVCAVTSLIVGFNRLEAGTAIKRLMFPFAHHPWPRKTQLLFVDEHLQPVRYEPEDERKIARGDTLELFLVNAKGTLPDEAEMEYRIGKDEVLREPLRKTSLRDERGRQVPAYVARLLIVKGPFQFRAVGGDHLDMRWHEVDVVPPPLMESLQVTLKPPAYSLPKTPEEPSREPEDVLLPPNVGHMRGLVGTHVRIAATANKPLKSAHLRIKNDPPIPLPLDDDGLSFHAEFDITEATPQPYTWWVELVDQEGFSNIDPPRYDIQGVPDLVPEVYLNSPAGDLQVTPQAIVPLDIQARDDLGLKNIALIYRLNESEDSPEVVISLAENLLETKQFPVTYTWNLGQMNPPPPLGSRIMYHAQASDYFDLGPEQIGRSQPRALIIVTPEEKGAELNARQSGLLQDLMEIQKQQAQAYDQAEELLIQLNTAQALRPQDDDLLHALDYQHRHRIWEQLVDRPDVTTESVESRVRNILQELEQNKLLLPKIETRLRLVADELRALKENDLPQVAQHFSQVIGLSARDATAPANPPDPNLWQRQAQELQAIRRHQNTTLDALSEMINLLSEWQQRSNLTGDLQTIIGGQETLNLETAQLLRNWTQRNLLGKLLSELTPQEKADLEKLATRQQKQAASLEEFRNRLKAMEPELRENETLTTQLLLDMLQSLSTRTTEGKMNEASRLLGNNKLGEGIAKQQEVLEELTELNGMLSNQPETNTENLVRKLKKAEEELLQLLKKQEELTEQLEELHKRTEDPAEKEPELQRLQKEQQDLRNQTEFLSRRLRRDARESSQSLRRSADNMKEAERPTTPELEKLEKQQEAVEDLKQAQRELAEQRQRAEEQLAREYLEKIVDEFPGLIKREESLLGEVQRLEAARLERGNWSRSQLKTLQNQVTAQQQLQTDMQGLIEKVQTAEVLALSLQSIARQMNSVERRLDDRLANEGTQQQIQTVIARLQTLMETLKSSQQDQQAAQPQGSNGPSGQQQNQPANAVPPLAQLRMLKTLQEDILRETSRLHTLRERTGRLPPSDIEDLNAMIALQAQIAELTQSLLSKIQQPIEVDPLQELPQPKETP